MSFLNVTVAPPDENIGMLRADGDAKMARWHGNGSCVQRSRIHTVICAGLLVAAAAVVSFRITSSTPGHSSSEAIGLVEMKGKLVQNVHNGKCLDWSDERMIHTHICDENSIRQRWKYSVDDFSQLKTSVGDYCMDSGGDLVHLWNCCPEYSQNHQHWVYDANLKHIKTFDANFCLEAQDDGLRIKKNKCDAESERQKWKLKKDEDPTPPPTEAPVVAVKLPAVDEVPTLPPTEAPVVTAKLPTGYLVLPWIILALVLVMFGIIGAVLFRMQGKMSSDPKSDEEIGSPTSCTQHYSPVTAYRDEGYTCRGDTIRRLIPIDKKGKDRSKQFWCAPVGEKIQSVVPCEQLKMNATLNFDTFRAGGSFSANRHWDIENSQMMQINASVRAELMGQGGEVGGGGERNRSNDHCEDGAADVKSKVDFVIVEYNGAGESSTYNGHLEIISEKYSRMEWKQMNFPDAWLERENSHPMQQQPTLATELENREGEVACATLESVAEMNLT